MTQIWWVDEAVSFRTVKSWRQQGPAVSDEQLAVEAQRAVRDFRTRQLPVLTPASGKLTREMLLKAKNHVYEYQPLPVHPDEYARIIKERREWEAAERIRHFTQAAWYSWYDDALRRAVRKPSSPGWASHLVVTRLDE